LGGVRGVGRARVDVWKGARPARLWDMDAGRHGSEFFGMAKVVIRGEALKEAWKRALWIIVVVYAGRFTVVGQLEAIRDSRNGIGGYTTANSTANNLRLTDLKYYNIDFIFYFI